MLTGKYSIAGVAVVALSTGVISCATIMHGTSQGVGISSAPTGATVTIDNAEKGKTPIIAKLSRGDNHIVKVQLEGYEIFEATITRQTSGWVWGNIVFGGIIGLAVDAMSGGLYKLTPEQITAELHKSGADLHMKDDVILVQVTLRPNERWEKIGELERTSS